MFKYFLLILAGLIAFSSNASANVDFAGKNITWVVPEGSGGPNYANM